MLDAISSVGATVGPPRTTEPVVNDVEAAAPGVMNTSPPVAADFPAATSTGPPEPDVPVPTTRLIEPPRPPDAGPVRKVTAPELPAFAAPVLMEMSPETPAEEAFADVRDNEPEPALVLEPDDKLIDPPNPPEDPVVLPADSKIAPPSAEALVDVVEPLRKEREPALVPLDESPTVIEMEPPLPPAVDGPVTIIIWPVLPAIESPVAKLNVPEAPAEPTLALWITILPLPELALEPEETTTTPPKTAPNDRPADNTREPAAPDALEPTKTLTEPALPPEAVPD